MVGNDVDFTVLFVVVELALIGLVEAFNVVLVLSEGCGGIVVVFGV
jgi:hypothetical protein